MQIIAAGHPLQAAAARRGEPHLLRERLAGLQVVLGGDGQLQLVDIALDAERLVIRPRGDRRQRVAAKAGGQRCRQYVVLARRAGRGVGADDAVARVVVRAGLDAERRPQRRVEIRCDRAEIQFGIDAARVIHLGARGRQQQVRPRGEIDLQLTAHDIALHVVGVARARDQIARRRALIVPHAGNPEAGGIRQRPRDRAGQPPDERIASPVESRKAGVDMPFERMRWPLGDDVDDARRHVLAVEGGLRPLQHFEPRDIDQIVDAEARSRHVDAIDEQADIRFECRDIGVRADPAQAIALRDHAVRLDDRQRRHERRHRLHPDHARIAQVRTAQRRNGDRNVLQRLLALLRGDDDVRQHGLRRLRILRQRFLRMKRHSGRAENGQHDRTKNELPHGFPSQFTSARIDAPSRLLHAVHVCQNIAWRAIILYGLGRAHETGLAKRMNGKGNAGRNDVATRGE